MALQWRMKSAIGPLYLIASDRGLRSLLWKETSVPFAKSLSGAEPGIRTLARAVRQLEEYFEGKRQDFDLELDIQGTNFQKSVWRQLARIPYGETCSYSDIARRIKNDKAVRAVGTANGRNPLSIVIPCHRVIASDGSLAGYAGGLPIKMRLLKLEGISVKG